MSFLQKPIDWVKTVWNKSFTTAWGKIQMAVGGVTGVLGAIYPWISDATVKGYLDTVQIPHWASVTLGALGLVTYLAHGREND